MTWPSDLDIVYFGIDEKKNNAAFTWNLTERGRKKMLSTVQGNVKISVEGENKSQQLPHG